MPTWLARLLWMALQAGIVLFVVLLMNDGTLANRTQQQVGGAFLLGCGVAIAVTFLLTKGYDLTRAAIVRRREISLAKVALASAYCAALPFAVMLGRHLQASDATGLALLVYLALFAVIPAWIWIDRSERRWIAAERSAVGRDLVEVRGRAGDEARGERVRVLRSRL